MPIIRLLRNNLLGLGCQILVRRQAVGPGFSS